MKLALHFDAMHAQLGNPYHLPAQRLVFAALLAQRDSYIDSKIFTGDLLFTHVPGLKAADAVGLWFFPQNPVWTSPNGVDWNLPPHIAIYAVCFESVDRETAERLHEGLVGSAAYLGAVEVGDSPTHKQLWSKLPARCRIVHQAAQVFCDGDPKADRDEALFEQLQSLGFDPVSWETWWT